ncbi:MAG: tetratricopeptide repeat protein [Bacteroidota bacterium]
MKKLLALTLFSFVYTCSSAQEISSTFSPIAAADLMANNTYLTQATQSQLTSVDNDLLESYIDQGYVKYEQKDYQGAIEAFDRVLEFEPFLSSHAKAYCIRGLAKEQLERKREALEDYTWAIEVNPKYAEAYYRKAVIYAEFEILAHAIDNCNIAIQLNPNFADARALRDLAKMKLGTNK